MGFTTLDYLVVVIYLVAVAVFGILSAGRQRTTKDYFLGGRDMPWWAVLFSVVATETSTLTFISVPAVAYGGSLLFMQLTIGYILGRTAVAIFFLPAYIKGELTTAYEYLGQRFGQGMRSATSYTFIVTRVLADGVRLFATAIPLAIILRLAGAFPEWTDLQLYALAIGLISSITLIYTFLGGIKAVIWMDVVQMTVYIGGGLFAAFVMLGDLPISLAEGWDLIRSEGKLQMFNFGGGMSLGEILADPYVFWVAVFGGAVFSVASHGTDQLVVQRLLTTRNLTDARKAVVWSGIVVAFQFFFFLGVGLMLYLFYEGAGFDALGLQTVDEIFALFIVEEIPSGMAGLIIAALIAAAMSTLSSSLNALASALTFDILKPSFGQAWDSDRELFISRMTTIFWGVVLTSSALFFAWLQLNGGDRPAVVELGLGIASYTYGGLLGAFLLGLLFSKPDKTDAMIGFFSGLISLLFMVEGALQNLLPGSGITLAWPLYTLVGGLVVILVGNLSWWIRTGRK
ncbi:MAG: sodium:solute symporter [Balneolaceae bacterium]